MNNKSRFSGIVPPLVTPLNKDEIVCKDSLHKLIDHCLNNGVSGVFVNGTSGEAMRVSDSVWEEMTKETLAYVGDRGVVFCGAIDSSTTRVIEKIKKIEALGGKIAVCTPPFYLANFGQDEILRHYDRICNQSKIEIAIYNIPDTTHVNILPRTIAKLADYENVVVYKDSCADWQQFQRNIYYLHDKDISLFNGAEELCAASMLFGAQGCIPGLANFFPDLFVQLYEVCKSGNITESYELQKKICEVRDCLFEGPAWISVMKYLLSVYDLGEEYVSWPIPEMTDEHKNRVLKILRECGVLNA